MKKLETLLALLLLLALTFRIMHWPYTGILLILSLSGLSVYQFPVSFLFFSLRIKQPLWVAFNLVSSLVFALFPIAILFLVMYWPALGPIMDICVFGSPVLLLLSIGALLYAKSPEQRLFAKNRVYRAVVATIISVYLMQGYFV